MSESSDKMPPPSEPPLSKQEKVNLERQEEQKLRAKYPAPPAVRVPGGGAGGGGHSAFLQKRLAKGQKYFDSGDYQMAKQKSRPGLPGTAAGGGPGGLAAGPGRLAMPVLANQPPTGDTIPTPELVPARKSSIIQPLYDHSQSMHLASDPAHTAPEPGRPLINPAIAKLTS